MHAKQNNFIKSSLKVVKIIWFKAFSCMKLNFCESSWYCSHFCTLCPLTECVGWEEVRGGDPAIWNSVSLTGWMEFCFFLCFKELQPWKLKVARDFQNFACVHRAARNSAVWKGCSYNLKKTLVLLQKLTKSCWYAPARCLLWKMKFECCFPSMAKLCYAKQYFRQFMPHLCPHS